VHQGAEAEKVESRALYDDSKRGLKGQVEERLGKKKKSPACCCIITTVYLRSIRRKKTRTLAICCRGFWAFLAVYIFLSTLHYTTLLDERGKESGAGEEGERNEKAVRFPTLPLFRETTALVNYN
jgi:hypothetical protein